MRKKQLIEQLAAAKDKRRKETDRLTALSASGTETVSADDIAALQAMDAPIEALEAELRGIEQLEAAARARAAESEPREPAQVHNNAQDKPWQSFGEFLRSVVLAGSPGGTKDPRLFKFAPTGSGEVVPADGGYAVGVDWSNQIMRRVNEVGTLAAACNRVPIGPGSNGISLPYVDETSRATGSRFGGVRVYRAAEAATVTAAKPKLGRLEIKLEKLMGLWYATEELITDATAMEAIAVQAFGEEMAFVLDDEILSGDGVGKCLGILACPALVTITKETGQASATVVYENINKMWNAMPATLRGGAVWYINQEIEPQLETMDLSVGTGGVPVWMPSGGAQDAPLARLKGRPVRPIEQCSALGTAGDIVLANMSQYLLISKGGLSQDVSMHVRFLYDETAFRWTYRISGQPAWKSAIAPYKGSVSRSPFVTLGAR